MPILKTFRRFQELFYYREKNLCSFLSDAEMQQQPIMLLLSVALRRFSIFMEL
jgi:hypothetical protein